MAVVGIDKYEKWPILDNAVQDALGTQKALVEDFGFVAPIAPILNEDATRDRILRLVEDDLRKELVPDDNLILFFAGHGHTRTDRVGDHDVDSGYLVPVESRFGAEERWGDYIEIENLLRQIARLEARHILVILDSCHSGFALAGAAKYRGIGDYEATLQSNVSRVVITSARKAEEAIDSGPIFGHSLFSGTLIEGLNRGAADLDNNKLITSNEIGLYLQQAVANSSESKQTPDSGAFFLDERGQMVIPMTVGEPVEAVKRQAYAALARGYKQELQELLSKLVGFGDALPDVEYLNYRLRLAEKDTISAIEHLVALDDLRWTDGTVPMSRHDVNVALIRADYWHKYLDLDTESFPLEVEFLSGSEPDDLQVRSPVFDQSFEGHEIQANSYMSVKVTNPTDDEYYLYMIDIDQEGRIEPVPLWSSAEQASGIAPHSSRASNVFKHVGSSGASQFRFYASKTVSHALLFPLGTAARGVAVAPEVSEQPDMQSMTLNYRAVLVLPKGPSL